MAFDLDLHLSSLHGDRYPDEPAPVCPCCGADVERAGFCTVCAETPTGSSVCGCGKVELQGPEDPAWVAFCDAWMQAWATRVDEEPSGTALPWELGWCPARTVPAVTGVGRVA